MNFTELKENVNKKFYPVILLEGSDDFLINLSVDYISAAYIENLKELNLIEYDFNDPTDFDKVMDSIETMPAMSEHKVVVIKNLSLKKLGSKSERSAKLVEYTKKPNIYTCLVLVNVDIKGIIPSEKVNCNYLSAEDLARWVVSYTNKNGREISQSNAKLLISFTGRDMMIISREIKKLCDYKDKNQEIKKEDIEKVVERSLDYQVYDLSNKLSDGKNKEALDILDDIISSSKYDESLVLGTIFSTYRRMMHISLSKETDDELAKLFGVQPYSIAKARQVAKRYTQVRLKKALDLLVESDIRFKQNQISKEEILKFVVLSLMNI